ncbi:CBS domain-containing protein [Halegenticoccus tardaugens]|uniref:CBS domain-containing protein n=1 Tax=Halegenticoccus tardaugens TaxID=2071624 RepID=UPI00100A87E7|nr:CBS domain-containing protein [Halegenticoccus tardaugens]
MDTDKRTRVGDVMSTPVQTISSKATVREAATTMRDHGISALLVPGSATAIVTSTDVLNAVADGHDASELRVADVMTSPVETITSNLMMEEAAAMMTNFGIKHLPVVDADGDVVGMVSSTDITVALS